MKNVLTSKSFVIIVSHKGPDGDSIGSSVALSRYLRKLKVNNIIDQGKFLKTLGIIERADILSKNMNF